MSEEIESYWRKARLWWEDGKRPHGQRCPCIVCADFRVFMRMRPLIPTPTPAGRVA